MMESIFDKKPVVVIIVVTSDIPPFEVWAGVPARKIRER